MDDRTRNDLNWLAFQYVAGDLSLQEAMFFEERLANDQMAREAVAWAVELTQVSVLAIQRAGLEHDATTMAQPTRVPSGWGTRRTSWIGGAIAAGFALVLLFVKSWLPSTTTHDRAGRGSPVPLAETRELVLAWITSQSGLDQDSVSSEVANDDQLDDTRSIIGGRTLGISDMLGISDSVGTGDSVGIGDSVGTGDSMGTGDEVYDLEAPSWMLTAVASVSRNDDGDTRGVE